MPNASEGYQSIQLHDITKLSFSTAILTLKYLTHTVS